MAFFTHFQKKPSHRNLVRSLEHLYSDLMNFQKKVACKIQNQLIGTNFGKNIKPLTKWKFSVNLLPFEEFDSWWQLWQGDPSNILLGQTIWGHIWKHTQWRKVKVENVFSQSSSFGRNWFIIIKYPVCFCDTFFPVDGFLIGHQSIFYLCISVLYAMRNKSYYWIGIFIS